MFTGIIEGQCKIISIRKGGASATIEIDMGALADGVKVGDSVAMDGACLSVVRIDGTNVACNIMTETLRRTTLEEKQAGDLVNVERALRVGDRLGGHFVLGHVDGVGTVREKRNEPGQVVLLVEAAERLTKMMIEKGSVAIDGVSLTLVDVEKTWFSVALIPLTLAETGLGRKQRGDKVNIECDMLGKWVAKLLHVQNTSDLSIDFLREHGFA